MAFGGGEEIRYERPGKAGVATLTCRAALNAVTHRMVPAPSRALDAWTADPAATLAVWKAERRAFPAGGHILHCHKAGLSKTPPTAFFAV